MKGRGPLAWLTVVLAAIESFHGTSALGVSGGYAHSTPRSGRSMIRHSQKKKRLLYRRMNHNNSYHHG